MQLHVLHVFMLAHEPVCYMLHFSQAGLTTSLGVCGPAAPIHLSMGAGPAAH